MKTKAILLGLTLALIPGLNRAENGIKMVVGTYTDAGSKGLYSFSFDDSNGSAKELSSLKVDNPSYFTFSKNGRFIYAVSEKNNATAALNAISFDPVKGDLGLMNSQLTHGADPCYVDTDGKIALTANYSSGTISVFPILKNGTLDKSLLMVSSKKADLTRHVRIRLTPIVLSLPLMVIFFQQTLVGIGFLASIMIRIRKNLKITA